MRISFNWLKKYIDINISPEELAESLTMVGLEVESIDRLADKYNSFLIGKVVEIQKHPKADKLTVCRVDIGREILQIVCGAPNVAVGQKVPVGMIGAEVPRNQHDLSGTPLKLTQVKLRGVDSFGMICSEFELQLGDDKDGIMVLDSTEIVGRPLAEYLNLSDVILDIGITPNRADALSHIGIAREVSAILNLPVKYPIVKVVESSRKVDDFAKVIVDNNISCPRYTARVIFDVKIEPSPKWMQNDLTAVGIRPINNIVDITNYVLMEYGHPLHAFDYDKLSGKTIVVKSALGGEEFTTLDHKLRILQKDTLLICDTEKPIAIAGIIGGINSEIFDRTKNVLLESAYFNPRIVRKTAKYLGLSTDAAQRFERGTDPNITKLAVDRAAQLIREICCGEILKNIIDVYTVKQDEKIISLRVDKTNELLGLKLSDEKIIELLSKINIRLIRKGLKPTQDLTLYFSIPTYRCDLEHEVDLIEEVARIFGYDNIPVKETATIKFSKITQENCSIDYFRQKLVGCGLIEIVSNSMQNASIAKITSQNIVMIANPISKDMEALRTSLIPSMLEIIQNNINHGSKDLRLFEIGTIYQKNSSQIGEGALEEFKEIEQILVAFTGLARPKQWDEKPRSSNIFDLKGEMQSFFEKISLDNIKFIPYPISTALSESVLHIEINGEYAGLLGFIRKEKLDQFDVDQDVFVAELVTEVLMRHQKKNKKYIPLPKYPSVMRDIAVIVEAKLPSAEIHDEIEKAGKPLLKKIELFDIYLGDQVDSGMKSCAFALEFMADDHTLTQSEIDAIMKKISKNLESKFNAALRK